MRVDWAIACRYVEVNGSLATIVGAGIDTYYPVALPAQLSVLIALRVVGPQDTTPTAHTLVSTVLDPEMSQVANLEMPFMSQPNPDSVPGWEVGAILPTVHTFVAEVEGAYTISISVDGAAHTVPVIVRLAEQDPA